jgi:carbonic anhydrase
MKKEDASERGEIIERRYTMSATESIRGAFGRNRMILVLALAALGGRSRAEAGQESGQELAAPETVWKDLEAGNRRYREAVAAHPRQDSGRRASLSASQHPKAVVLSCSDSRVPPEIVFDQGLGDLFVIRVAGNVVCPETLASVEYAVEHLGVVLVVVMGHKRCGAVQAALEGGHHEGHLDQLLEGVTVPSRAGGPVTPEACDVAVRGNVKAVVGKLRSSAPVLTGLISERGLKILGAYYDLDSGEVLGVSD